MGKAEEEAGDKAFKLKAAAFLAFTGGFGMFAGFAGALGQTKKQDPGSFDRGLTGVEAGEEEAAARALRRLDRRGHSGQTGKTKSLADFEILNELLCVLYCHSFCKPVRRLVTVNAAV